MKIITSIFSYLLISLMVSVAYGAGDSINDAFKALTNSDSGSESKPTGLGALSGLANDEGNSDAGTGHGIKAGLKAIEANEAAQAAEAERQRRIRMEQEAQKQEQEMSNNCKCILWPCIGIIDNSDPCESYKTHEPMRQDTTYWGGAQFGQRYVACLREERAKAEWKKEHAEEIAEQERREQQEKRRVCEAWKAAGPKANSETFKAQLRQQDVAIASRQREADQLALQRDALIQADEKAQLAKERAAYDANNAKVAREEAEAKAKADEEEAKFKASCLSDVDYGRCGCLKYYPPRTVEACRQ
jgi:hypothetical protein